MPLSPPDTTPDDDVLFRLLRQLDTAPEQSQRATAQALGMSLGRLNTLLRRLRDDDLLSISDRAGPDKRARFNYTLTTKGAATKARLADQFLARKRA